MFDEVCANRETHIERNMCLLSNIKCETKRVHKNLEHKIRQRKRKRHCLTRCTNNNTVCLSREWPLQISQCKTFFAVFQQAECDRFRRVLTCCFRLGVVLIVLRKVKSVSYKQDQIKHSVLIALTNCHI
jgi:hypothetical protein